jgi:hypothetical protein
MFTIATVRHSGSHIVQSIELGRRGLFLVLLRGLLCHAGRCYSGS